MSDKEYDIEIKETFSTIIKVEASSEREAIRKAQDKYNQPDVKLISDCNVHTDIGLASENGNIETEDDQVKDCRRKESTVLKLLKEAAKVT